MKKNWNKNKTRFINIPWWAIAEEVGENVGYNLNAIIFESSLLLLLILFSFIFLKQKSAFVKHHHTHTYVNAYSAARANTIEYLVQQRTQSTKRVALRVRRSQRSCRRSAEIVRSRQIFVRYWRRTVRSRRRVDAVGVEERRRRRCRAWVGRRAWERSGKRF